MSSDSSLPFAVWDYVPPRRLWTDCPRLPYQCDDLSNARVSGRTCVPRSPTGRSFAPFTPPRGNRIAAKPMSHREPGRPRYRFRPVSRPRGARDVPEPPVIRRHNCANSRPHRPGRRPMAGHVVRSFCSAARMGGRPMVTVTIVIPCFTEQRWDSLLRAVQSACNQTYDCQVIVAVDHNERLLEQLQRHTGTDVLVVPSSLRPGASGARNTGARLATSELLAFSEDDAVAEPTWIERLVQAYEDTSSAVGFGGAIR